MSFMAMTKLWAALVVCSIIARATGQGARDRLPNLDISDREIYSLVDELRRNDANRARPSDIQVDYQGHTSTRDASDNARSTLVSTV